MFMVITDFIVAAVLVFYLLCQSFIRYTCLSAALQCQDNHSLAHSLWLLLKVERHSYLSHTKPMSIMYRLYHSVSVSTLFTQPMATLFWLPKWNDGPASKWCSRGCSITLVATNLPLFPFFLALPSLLPWTIFCNCKLTWTVLFEIKWL